MLVADATMASRTRFVKAERGLRASQFYSIATQVSMKH